MPNVPEMSATPRPKVLFGGAFDPVHLGHLIVARSVAEQMGYDRITLLLSGRAPHKGSAHASAADRLAMLQLAVRDDPLFEVCDLELQRTGPSYTYDTVGILREQLGPDVPIRMIVGADMFRDLPLWHRAAQLVQCVRFVVALRPPLAERIDEIVADVRRALAPGTGRKLPEAIVATPLIDVSSTEIRQRVAKGRPIRYLVPESVARHIADNGLYARPRRAL